MNAEEFNNEFMNPILEKITNENKEVYIMGDFNINLLNYETNKQTSGFLNNMYENGFSPYINIPTRITPRSKTLIDNIFTNKLDEQIISGNITSTMSDHLIQFLIKPKEYNNSNKQLIYRRNFKKFNEEKFKNELQKINWVDKLQLGNQDVHFSFQTFHQEIEKLLDEHAPIKPLSKNEIKKINRPWITKGLRI